MGAWISVSIFMASVTSTGWPAVTRSPSLTSTSTMLPGMEVATWPGALGLGRLPTIAFLTAPSVPPVRTSSSRVSTHDLFRHPVDVQIEMPIRLAACVRPR